MTMPTTRSTTSSSSTAAAGSTTAQVLAAEIEQTLTRLRPLANQVGDLVDSYQPTLAGIAGAQAITGINDSIREHRVRVDTTTRPVGQQWMRGTTADKPLGAKTAAARSQAASSVASIAFTLTDLVHRLQVSVDRAGVGICFLPRLPQDRDLTALEHRLRQLAHQAAEQLPAAIAIPKLRRALRELEHLVTEADTVIDGTQQTPYGDCPHCGRPTITVDFREGVIRCDVDRRTATHEPCRCGDEYCLCRHKPLEFRHQWFMSRAGVKKDGWQRFKYLRAHPAPPAEPPAAQPTTPEYQEPT